MAKRILDSLGDMQRPFVSQVRTTQKSIDHLIVDCLMNVSCVLGCTRSKAVHARA
jgi:hypothetical protein